MPKIITITLLMILILPLVYSLNKENHLSCGINKELEVDCFNNAELSFLGRLAVAEAEIVVSPISQGTSCDAVADINKKCYYTNTTDHTCIEGCPEGYYCSDNYRCSEGKLVIQQKITTLLETTKEKKKVIIAGILVLSLIGIGIISEEELKRRKLKKGELILTNKKEEDEERKKNQEKLPKVEEVETLKKII